MTRADFITETARALLFHLTPEIFATSAAEESVRIAILVANELESKHEAAWQNVKNL